MIDAYNNAEDDESKAAAREDLIHSLDGGQILPVDKLGERIIAPLLEQAMGVINNALSELFIKIFTPIANFIAQAVWSLPYHLISVLVDEAVAAGDVATGWISSLITNVARDFCDLMQQFTVNMLTAGAQFLSDVV